MSDCWFSGAILVTSTDGCAFWLEYSNSNAFSGPIYLGGSSDASSETADSQMYVKDSEDCQFGNIRIDVPGEHGLRIHETGEGDVRGNQFNTLQVTRCLGAANTWDAIQLDGEILYHRFMNVYITATRPAGVGNNWRYGWNENTATCDWNAILGAYIMNCATANTRIQGANSTASHIN